MSILFDDNILEEDFSIDEYDDVVTEAYYGKPREFIAVEKELDIIIQIIKDGYAGKIKSYSLNSNITKVGNMIAKYFRFKSFNLVISQGVLNAYTYPVSFPKFYSRDKLFKNRPDPKIMGVTVYITEALILQLDLTGEELLAIILHEIGHNMDRSIFFMMSYCFPPSILTFFIPYFNTWTADFRRKMEDSVTSIPNVARLTNKVVEVITSVLVPLNKITADPTRIATQIVNPRIFFGYVGERYADSFAVAYGYGAATARVFKKFDEGIAMSEKAIYKTPILSTVYDATATIVGLPFAIVDEHPKDIIRIHSVARKLRNDLKDPSIPKELKRDIEEQLDYVDETIEKMIDVKNSENGRLVSKVVNYLIVRVFDGMIDPREFLVRLFKTEE